MASPASPDELTYDLQPNPTSPSLTISYFILVPPVAHPSSVVQHTTPRSVHCAMSRISHAASYPSSSHSLRHCQYGQELSLVSLLLPIAPLCLALKRHSHCEEASERWWGPCEETFESSWVLTRIFERVITWVSLQHRVFPRDTPGPQE